MVLFRKVLLAFAAIGLLVVATTTTAIKVDDEVPKDIELHLGFPPERINVHDRIKDKKVLLIGLPGAFTPT